MSSFPRFLLFLAGVVLPHCSLARVKTLKDLAVEMGLTVCSVRRWMRRLGIVATVPGHASMRFSNRDAKRFVRLWQRHWQRKYDTPSRPYFNAPCKP